MTDSSRTAQQPLKPSDLFIAMPPFAATLQKAENEHLAALLVLVCQRTGDVWQPVTFNMLNDHVLAPIRRHLEQHGDVKTLEPALQVAHTIFMVTRPSPVTCIEKFPEFFDGDVERGFSLTESAKQRIAARWRRDQS